MTSSKSTDNVLTALPLDTSLVLAAINAQFHEMAAAALIRLIHSETGRYTREPHRVQLAHVQLFFLGVAGMKPEWVDELWCDLVQRYAADLDVDPAEFAVIPEPPGHWTGRADNERDKLIGEVWVNINRLAAVGLTLVDLHPGNRLSQLLPFIAFLESSHLVGPEPAETIISVFDEIRTE